MEVAKPKYVWWDVDCLNVPRDRDPYEVRWIIESALNKKFGAGPVTIFAMGNLNRIPYRVLELISLAGIVLKHTNYGGRHIYGDLFYWTIEHPPPAIIMLISDREYEYIYLEAVEARGYTIIRTYVNMAWYSPKYASDVWLWKSLLTDTERETPRPRLELQGKCCETDWYCKQCNFKGQGFTDFPTHCNTKDHLAWEWLAVHPDASVEPTDEDLDSLHSQLMKHAVKLSKPRRSRGCHIPKTDPMTVKLLSKPHKGFKSLMPFRQACNVGPQDCSVSPTEKDLASLHSQPKKHTVTVKKQSKPHKCKQKESYSVPRDWGARPSEEGLPFSFRYLATQEEISKTFSLLHHSTQELSKESYSVPRDWGARPSEEGLPFSFRYLSTQEENSKAFSLLHHSTQEWSKESVPRDWGARPSEEGLPFSSLPLLTQEKILKSLSFLDLATQECSKKNHLYEEEEEEETFSYRLCF